jgi:hypothetical protein
MSKRVVSILAIVGAMGTALIATPTLARQPRSVAHAYKTPPPTPHHRTPTAIPSGSGPSTGGGGMYAVAGTKPAVSNAPSYTGSAAPSSKGLPQSLPATGGAAH